MEIRDARVQSEGISKFQDDRFKQYLLDSNEDYVPWKVQEDLDTIIGAMAMEFGNNKKWQGMTRK